MARLTSTGGKLCMHLLTSYPGLQFYSGNYLAGLPARDGREMGRHPACCVYTANASLVRLQACDSFAPRA